MCIFFDFPEIIRPDRGIFVLNNQKNNRYACNENARWLALGPIRESLPDKGTGRKTGTRDLRVGVQGKAHAIQKEIGNYRFSRFFHIFVVSFYHVSPFR